jgi:hypothetical protein
LTAADAFDRALGFAGSDPGMDANGRPIASWRGQLKTIL